MKPGIIHSGPDVYTGPGLPHEPQPHQPWLAPLAGYSDLPFRLLCREHGAAVTCTEMVSAKGLIYASPGTRDLLRRTAEDAPLVLQLFGCEPETLARAMPPLLEQGFTHFDLNMGCSVPKVNRAGCGSAMLKDVDNAVKVAKVMTALARPRHVGFKIRLGWDDNSHVWRDLALRLQEAGAGWISLHPRTARQGFGGTAHWEYLAQLAELLDIPVIASGDLFTAEQGVRCLRETGVASVMYARGAMSNPGIFAAHKALLRGEVLSLPSPEAVRALIRRHAALACAHGSEKVALFKMRTFVPRYVHHLPGVRLLRQGLTQCQDWATLDRLLDEFLSTSTPTDSA